MSLMSISITAPLLVIDKVLIFQVVDWNCIMSDNGHWPGRQSRLTGVLKHTAYSMYWHNHQDVTHSNAASGSALVLVKPFLDSLYLKWPVLCEQLTFPKFPQNWWLSVAVTLTSQHQMKLGHHGSTKN